MVLMGQLTALCYDGFVGDGVPPFMDAGGLAFGYGYHPQLPEEECLLGSYHPWESPTGVLGAEPGNASAFGGHDVGWSTHATGVSSSASASSSVLTFEGLSEEYRAGAAWMDATDQLQLSYSPSRTTMVTMPASFSFAGCGGNDPTAPTSQKRSRAHVQSQDAGAEEQETTTPKKQYGGNRKATTMSSPPKDPQSQVAKNRRERIGERLRTLQELVPNGGKVDMVTMLDKAITYVKFMQLQLKVLETDAFWPAQGGEAPEISQVKAALDAIILSSSQQPHRWS